LPISEGKLEEEKESAIGTGTTGSNGNGSMDLSRSSRTTTPEPVDQTDDRSIIFLNEHNNRSQAIKSNLPVAQFQNIILPENLRLSQKNRNKSSVISPSISTLPITYYHSSHLLGPHLNKSINDDYEHDNVQNLMGIGDFREGKDRFLFPKNYSGFSSDNVPDKPERSCRVYYKNFQTGFENFLLPQNSHTQAEIKTKDLDGRIYINNFEHSSLEHFILSKLDPDFKKSLDSISTISEVSKASKESSSRRSLPSLSSKNAKKSRKRGRSSVCSKTSSKVEEIAKTFKKPVEIKKEQKSSISTSNITKISFDDFFCEKTTFMHPCCDETFKIVLQQEMYEEEQSKQRQAAEMKLKQKQQEQRKMQQKEEMKKAREKELQEKLIRQEKLRKTLKYNSKKADYLFWDSETDTRSDLEKFTLSVNPFRHRIKMKDFLPKKSSTFPSSSIKLPPKKRALDIQNEQAMKENFILPENVYKNCHKISVENFDTADKFVVSDCQFKRMRITEAAFVDGCHFILPRNEHENLIMEPRFEHFLTKMGENENYKSIQAEESHFLLPKSNSTLKSSDIQASNYFNKVEFSDFNTTDNRLLNNEHFMLPKFDDSLYQSLETMNYQEDESVEVYEIREDKWYKAKIVKFNMEKAEYYIHYQGWNNKYDFWLGFKDGRERIRRTSGQSSACTSNSKDDANTTTDELKVIPTYKIGQIVIARFTDGLEYPAKILNLSDGRSTMGVVSLEYLSDGMRKKQKISSIREEIYENEGKDLSLKATMLYESEITKMQSFEKISVNMEPF